MHDYHQGLPGYSEAQILHDKCGECEERSKSRNLGIATLDRSNFRRAWLRATAWNAHGLDDISRAERPMLDAIWSLQCQLEQYGLPIGTLPGDLRD